MELETILNALILVSSESLSDTTARQYDAFRERILRMDAEKDATNQMLREKTQSLERAIIFRERHRSGGRK